MEHTSANKKQQLKKLHSELKMLQADLTVAQKISGIDEYIGVKVQKDKARFERIRMQDEKDKAFGHFVITIDIIAKNVNVFIPMSIASGKKTTGFMYQIEGTAEGRISSADVDCRGDGVTKITVGTILYAKIPSGMTATFRIKVTIRGALGKTYKIILNRIHYKLAVTEARYKQYIKEIVSDSVTFS